MLKVGLIGCGTIGKILSKAVDENPKIKMETIFDKEMKKAEELFKQLKEKPKIAKSFEDFLEYEWELAIEAASQEAVRDYSEKILEKGDLMVMSVGAFKDEKFFEKVYSKAEKYNRKVYIPSGAIAGIDGIKASSSGKIYEVSLKTTKNPISLGRTDKKAKLIYDGYAEEAAQLFPKNVNVCVTLSLASLGPKKTKVKIISDPKVKKNIHEVYVRGEFGNIYVKTENLPSPSNPKTSYLAPFQL